MKRSPVNKKRDQKIFKATSKPHPGNSTASFVMRGGKRK